jgi:hypothetical protein
MAALSVLPPLRLAGVVSDFQIVHFSKREFRSEMLGLFLNSQLQKRPRSFFVMHGIRDQLNNHKKIIPLPHTCKCYKRHLYLNSSEGMTNDYNESFKTFQRLFISFFLQKLKIILSH